MYLKSLELHGFKSFPNRTVLTFEKGATVIVGPNGSGKSNISDAMRWVLGELSSRNIRGTKMEDVIFGGTDERRPMGFAEVSVTFDNTDPENRLDSPFDEVIVTRRYYRSGESEYLINREPKRLRDIYELFMNTGVGREGYSIIGQGKVAEIVSKKSDERRTIFEEAAGISKYRHRKEESEKKLKNTQDNLDRVKDILSVLGDRVGPLEKEAEKAKRGLAIHEEKKRADVSLWLYDTKQILEDINAAEDALKLSKNQLDIVETVIKDLNAQNEDIYNRLQENKLSQSAVYDKIREATESLHRLDKELRVAESEYTHSAELIAQFKDRIAQLDDITATTEATKRAHIEKKEALLLEHKKIMDDKLEYLAKQQQISLMVDELKRKLDEALDELTVEENTLAGLKVRIDVLETSKASDSDTSAELLKEIEKYVKEGEELRAEAQRCEKNAEAFKLQLEAKDTLIAENTEKAENLVIEKEEISERYNQIKVKRDALLHKAATLQQMVEHFEGYGDSIKFVMREAKNGAFASNGKVYGPLSSLISVDKSYITAIETALGSSLQNIVVENEATAKAAMYALKKGNAGRATFYPVTSVRPQSETDEIRRSAGLSGYVGRADKLVNTESKFRSVIELLLLRTVVFEDLESASAAAKTLGYKVKIVTLDGQIINAGGSFTGGSAKRESGILSRLTEISDIKENAKKLDKDLLDCEDAIKEISAEHKDAIDTVHTLESERELLMTLSRGQFAALDNANAKFNANKNIQDKLKLDYESLRGKQTHADEEILSLGEDVRACEERIAALKEFRATNSQAMGEMDDERDRYGELATDLYVKAARILAEVEGVDNMIASVDERLSELLSEKNGQLDKIREIEQKRDSMDDYRETNSTQYKELEKIIEGLNDERRELEVGNDEYDKILAEIRVKLRERNSSRDVCYQAVLNDENNVFRLREKQEKLGAVLQDEYDLTYEGAVSLGYPPVTAENRDEIAALQAEAKRKLRSIGNYNPAAIEEYAEVKTQYDSLNTQYVDLTSSYDELIGIIARLEDEMKTSFLTAFEQINKNFGITFKELFGGGSAELNLVDPEDVLNTGIEIKAAPPGKIIKNMSLLSGGEQSFVAIALLFAILKVNPTPFCILDEIEAALDEVNVFRFGEYIKRLADDTQFILITHRRGTMEVGSRLYGITMPQRGISQAIALSVDEIEGKQKELLG